MTKAPAAVLVIAAALGAALGGGGTAARVVGLVLVAFGLMLATSLVFYEVGLSEDRELARELAARKRGQKEWAATHKGLRLRRKNRYSSRR